MNSLLLLDKNFMALSFVSIKKAVRLLVKGKAEPVTDKIVLGIKMGQSVFNLPSIIRLLEPVPWKAHNKKISFSRKTILLRDNYVCQYCGCKVGKNASIDHIVPKSRGGKNNYTNCVACCKACNNKKANKTPEESRMKLLSKPKNPTLAVLYQKNFNEYFKSFPEEWKQYLVGI